MGKNVLVNLINNTELIAHRLEEHGASDAKKPTTKLEKPYKKPGVTYKAPGSFKPFDDGGLKVKLLEVLSVAPTKVFSVIRDRHLLPQVRKIQREADKLNLNK